jgi:hypothetical protein
VTLKDGRNTNASSNSPFSGKATVTLYGTKATAVPVVVGEGLYLGAKYIAVLGALRAVAPSPSITQAKMNATALKGASIITVTSTSPLNWTAGQEISLAPTSYFTSTGTLWSNVSSSGVEKKIIKTIFISVQSGNMPLSPNALLLPVPNIIFMLFMYLYSPYL